ncbi:MAG: hotdog fold thioesterase [Nakamurella sp.]
MTLFPPVEDIPIGELATTMGISFTEATPDRVVATMPVEGNRQPFGLLHGGANAVLAETVGSVHASLLAGEDHIAVGVELNCTHHRSATDGIVTAVCVPLHAGRHVSTFHITISDSANRNTCTARLTCFIRSE